MTTLEEPTVNEPTVEPELSPEERAEEDAVVLEAVPVDVVLVPDTTTEPSVKLSNVIKSTRVVSKFIRPKSHTISSSTKIKTSAVVLALVRVKLKPTLMLF